VSAFCLSRLRRTGQFSPPRSGAPGDQIGKAVGTTTSAVTPSGGVGDCRPARSAQFSECCPWPVPDIHQLCRFGSTYQCRACTVPAEPPGQACASLRQHIQWRPGLAETHRARADIFGKMGRPAGRRSLRKSGIAMAVSSRNSGAGKGGASGLDVHIGIGPWPLLGERSPRD